MPAIVIYLMKSIVCSGILYAYYRIAFYNRINHHWNRFFLLLALVVSLILPLVKIYISAKTINTGSQVVRLLSVVATNDVPVDEMVLAQTHTFNTAWLLIAFYIIVSLVLLFSLIRSLDRISKIYHSSPKEKINHIQLVMTEEKDAPFSFLRTIFWSKRIDLHSPSGSRILEHEMVHVRQLHSLDRLLVNLLTAVFWCNPFFWLIRKELIAVHEFIADRKAVPDNNTSAFSEMILLSVFPGRKFNITSTFFNSSIKRRITMLTTFKNSRVGLLGKWFLLPVILLLLAAFSFRKKDVFVAQSASPFIVMIDAAHGGSSNGVSAHDGTREKDLNLSIAKKIKELNSNDHIKIVMTRESDEDKSVRERVENARRMGVNAFLSIHINRDQSSRSGIQLMMTKNDTEYAGKSQLLGSLLSQELNKVYKVDGELRKGSDKGVWVLDAPEINYPSVLIEFGNLNNSNDLEFIKSGENQAKIAMQILRAVAQFAKS